MNIILEPTIFSYILMEAIVCFMVDTLEPVDQGGDHLLLRVHHTLHDPHAVPRAPQNIFFPLSHLCIFEIFRESA